MYVLHIGVCTWNFVPLGVLSLALVELLQSEACLFYLGSPISVSMARKYVVMDLSNISCYAHCRKKDKLESSLTSLLRFIIAKRLVLS
jgi:hypothetical protein